MELENRLQPHDANTLYHNFLNKSQNYIQNLIIELIYSNKIVLENNKVWDKDKLNKRLFNNNYNYIKNGKQLIDENIVIVLEDNDYTQQIKERMGIYCTLINVVGCMLNTYQKQIQFRRYYNDLSDVEMMINIMDFVNVLDSDNIKIFQNHINFLNYQSGIDFDYFAPTRKLLNLFSFIKNIQLFDEDRDSDENNLLTQNEYLMLNSLKKYSPNAIFNEDIYLYTLIDAQLYDSNFHKLENRILNAGEKYLLNLVEINGIKVHKFDSTEDAKTLLLLDDKMFIHLFTEYDRDSEQFDIAIDKIANVISRDLYNDGSQIFRNSYIRRKIQNLLQEKDYSEYKYVNLNFEDQYKHLFDIQLD
jgi:hypothetical protein